MTREGLRALLAAGAGASVDTRTLQAGEVFFGLPGHQAHGAAFASSGLQKGAAAVVVPPDFADDLPPEKTFPHEDPLALLQEEAHLHRQRFPDVLVIAIGGSNGKTTTRALLSHILAQAAPTLFTPKSWNNAIGLPLTLLRLRPEYRYAVVEIGDNHPGEVTALAQLVRPTWALLTNVGLDHLEGYGTYEANLRTKWELIEALSTYSPQPKAFLNREDTGLYALSESANCEVVFFGKGGAVTGEWVPHTWAASTVHGWTYGEPFSVRVPLWGRFNRLNVLAAIAVARHIGLSWETIQNALESFSPEWGRSQIFQRSHQTIIFDAYNANPSSFQASLESLWEMLQPSEKVGLILGQMEELGSYAQTAHTAILTCLEAHRDKIAGLALIGPLFRPSAMSITLEAAFYDEVETLLQRPPSWLSTVPLLYLKGSRRVGLEKILDFAYKASQR